MVSNIGDEWGKTFPQNWPQYPVPASTQTVIQLPSEVSKSDFEALKKEVQELKKLLEAAKAFDAATGQPHCEMDQKVAMIKAIAKMVGVNLGSVFEPGTK